MALVSSEIACRLMVGSVFWMILPSASSTCCTRYGCTSLPPFTAAATAVIIAMGDTWLDWPNEELESSVMFIWLAR